MAVIANSSMSLDGFIAQADDDPGPVFDWWESGAVETAPGDPDRTFHISPASADYISRSWAGIGAEVIGRRLFDITDGWKGRPPAGGGHVVVVTHRPPVQWRYAADAPFEFVADLPDAIARAVELADGKDVSITGGDLTGQALAAGLVDELRIELTPVILGGGISFFGGYAGEPLLWEDPEVVQGERVTHLRYRRRR